MLSEQMRRLLQAIDAEDWATLRSLFSSDASYEVPGHEPMRGIDALLRYYREERDVQQGRHDVDHVLVDAPYAASWGRFKARTRSGERVDVRFMDLCRFDGQLIAERRVYLLSN